MRMRSRRTSLWHPGMIDVIGILVNAAAALHYIPVPTLQSQVLGGLNASAAFIFAAAFARRVWNAWRPIPEEDA